MTCTGWTIIKEYERSGEKIIIQTGKKLHRISVETAKEIMRRLNCSCLS